MNTIYKPYLTGAVGGGRAGVIMDAPAAFGTMQVVNSKGDVIDTLKPTSQQRGESGFKYVGSKPGAAYGNDVYLRFGNEDSGYGHIKLGSGGQGYGGDVNFGDLSSINSPETAATFGVYNHGPGGGAGRFAPGQMGYGFYPAYLGNEFPDPTFSKLADYKYTDPLEFAKKFGEYNRGEYQKNFEQASKLSLDTINNELKSLQSYVPATAALQREQTSLDNLFNQAQRTAQVNAALPGVNRQLGAQATRAEAYASGNLSDTMMNRALELGLRSQAADRATAGGFGATSSVARKASDLMSAQQRFQIGQYGEQLLGSNINAKAALNLAPTEYANAGSQVRIMPSLSASQLTQANQSELNQYSMITPTNALSSEVQQQQFRTSQEQGVNNLNTGISNEFKMGKFNYDVGYANTVAGAGQINMNTGLALEQQARAEQIAREQMERTQQANTIQSGLQAIGALAPVATNIINKLFPDNTPTTPGQYTGTNIPSISDVRPASPLTTGEIPDFNTGATVSNISGDYNVPGSEHIVTSGETPDFGTDTSSDLTFGPSTSLSSEATQLENYAGSISPAQAQSLIANPALRSFASETKLPSGASLRLAAMPATTAANIIGGTMENAGISTRPLPGYVESGVNFQGQTTYSDANLQKVNDTSPGVQSVEGLRNTLAPFGLRGMNEAIDSVASKVSDTALINQLDEHVKVGDVQGFVDTTQEAFNKPTTKSNTIGASVDTALAAYNVAQNWPRMSNGQKSLALASIGIQGIKTVGGKSLAETPIPNSARDGTQPLTVGGVLDVTRAGLSAVEVAAGWGDLNNMQRVVGGSRSAIGLAKAGVDAGLISKEGAVARNIPVAGLGLTAYQVASGWGKANAEGKIVGAASLAAAGAEAGMYAAIPGLNAALGIYSLGKMAQAGFEKYASGGTTNQKLAYGAAVIGTGLVGAAAIGAISLVNGLSKSGKPQDQKARDSIRSDWQARGLADDDYQMTLADGTKFDIGLDGNGGTHQARDPSKMTGSNPETELKAYNTDYTNDLDYASGMSGVTLQRLLYGGRNDTIDHMGAQMGNAMLGSVGYGKDMTPQNFNTVMANARGVYAKAGISSKEDALKLTALAAQQGRLSPADQAVAMQTFSMMYDRDGYDTGSKLLKGRGVGLNNMKDAPERAPTIDTPTTAKKVNPVAAHLASRYAPAQMPGREAPTIETNNPVGRHLAGLYAPQQMPTKVPPVEMKNIVPYKAEYLKNLNRSKEEMRANNQAKYAGLM